MKSCSSYQNNNDATYIKKIILWRVALINTTNHQSFFSFFNFNILRFFEEKQKSCKLPSITISWICVESCFSESENNFPDTEWWKVSLVKKLYNILTKKYVLTRKITFSLTCCSSGMLVSPKTSLGIFQFFNKSHK